jgi:hypothetical protein
MTVGLYDGAFVGDSVKTVGVIVGPCVSFEGALVGARPIVGGGVGAFVGSRVSSFLVGFLVGLVVGASVGYGVGFFVGFSVGANGARVGA